LLRFVVMVIFFLLEPRRDTRYYNIIYIYCMATLAKTIAYEMCAGSPNSLLHARVNACRLLKQRILSNTLSYTQDAWIGEE
jgi:hypothetical protein